MTTRNDHAIKLINALPVCGKDLRRVLLALAGEVETEAAPPDGTRWAAGNRGCYYEFLGGEYRFWDEDAGKFITVVTDAAFLDRTSGPRIPPTPPAAAPSPARTELEAAAGELVKWSEKVVSRYEASRTASCDELCWSNFVAAPPRIEPLNRAIARVRAALREGK